jgi:FlaA1/EpsC-like NDP-sugar epimerase
MNHRTLTDLVPGLHAPRRQVLLANALAFSLGDLLAFVAAQSLMPFAGNLAVQGYALMVLAWLMWNGIFQHNYTRHKPFWTVLKGIYADLLVFCGLGLAFVALTLPGSVMWRWLGLCALLVPLLPVARRLARALLSTCNLWEKPTVIFGVGENAHEAYLSFNSESSVGYTIKGFVCLPAVDNGIAISPVRAVPCALWQGSAPAAFSLCCGGRGR